MENQHFLSKSVLDPSGRPKTIYVPSKPPQNHPKIDSGTYFEMLLHIFLINFRACLLGCLLACVPNTVAGMPKAIYIYIYI